MKGQQILVVDDTAANVRLLEAVLVPLGYEISSAASGAQALDAIRECGPPDLVLLDIVMPEMDGYEVCRRLRADPATQALPIIMITSSGEQEKITALEVGADDFVPKPFNRHELVARVRSLLRVKRYQDTIQAQAAELAGWNRNLTARVEEQVAEIQRLAQLRRFLSPQLADLIVSSGDRSILQNHRRNIAVLFCDLRGFTSFAEGVEPEEVMTLLGQFHAVLGELVTEFEATVGHFAGDGLMVFFNDPLPCTNPAQRAVRLAIALREQMVGLTAEWRRRGHNVDVGVGITLGYATLGEIGFEGRVDYGAIGSVVNLASRLCDEAQPGQILISRPAFADVEDMVTAEPLADLTLKGFAKPVPALNVLGLRGEQATGARERYPDQLTEREVEVLRLVASGKSSREIGDNLVLSVRTVERHITNIYAKINARGRADATAYALKNGIAK
jgi:class 3 adenylate cyclase